MKRTGRTRKPNKGQRRGFGVVIILIVTALLGGLMLLAVLLRIGTQESQIAVNHAESTTAFFAADAGIEAGYDLLRSTWDWTMVTGYGGASLGNGTTYSVELTPTADPQVMQVTSTGQHRTARRNVEAIVRRDCEDVVTTAKVPCPSVQPDPALIKVLLLLHAWRER